MGKTAIQWSDMVWNPTRGCSRVSEGCRNCYAEHVAARFSGPGQPYEGLATRGPARWTGKVVLAPEHVLTAPLHWRKPRRVFVDSMSDLFHEAVPDEWIDRVFAVMALAPQHTFQVLTKRPERMRRWCEWVTQRPTSSVFAETPGFVVARAADLPLEMGPLTWPLPNVWLGVSVEDQATANQRIPELLSTPAAVRFVSYEPALGPVDWSEHGIFGLPDSVGLNWVIIGGESGPGARPFEVAWARSTIAQCRAAAVACFVKQLGAAAISEDDGFVGAAIQLDHEAEHLYAPLRDHKGGDWSEWPEDLRVREFPL